MTINKKLLATLCLASVVGFMAMTPPAAKPEEEEGFKNLKVLPKHISEKALDKYMGEWASALGVRCGFCHARNEETKKMDFASDAKPEKEMARHMFKMTAMLNKKYFEAKKDSIGLIMETGVNCNTCHRGTAHPELKFPEPHHGPGPGGPPPGGMPGGPGGPPPGGQGGGTPPPSGTPPPGGQK